MTSSKIELAREFAHDAHDSIRQIRKYSDAPYWVHTDAVADLVAKHQGTSAQVTAAHLHDVLEDVALFPDGRMDFDHKFGFEAIRRNFGTTVARYVSHLTDVFTSRSYPKWNRAARKALECNRFAFVPNEVKTIKLADIIDNTSDILRHDRNFAKVFIHEKNLLLPRLEGGNSELFQIARGQI